PVSVQDETVGLLLRARAFGRSVFVAQADVGRGDELEHRTVRLRVAEHPGKRQCAVRVAEPGKARVVAAILRVHELLHGHLARWRDSGAALRWWRVQVEVHPGGLAPVRGEAATSAAAAGTTPANERGTRVGHYRQRAAGTRRH